MSLSYCAIANPTTTTGTQEPDQFQCLLNYIASLNETNLISKKLPKDIVQKYDEKLCDKFVKKSMNDVYSALKNSLKGDKKTRTIADCIIDQLKKADYSEFAIQKVFLKLPKSFEVLNFNIRKMRQVIRNVDDSMDLETETATSECFFAEEKAKQFDQLVAVKNNKTEDETVKFYCNLRYLVAEKIIDPTTIQIKNDTTTPPKTDRECRKIVMSIKEQTETNLLTKKFKVEIENLTSVQTKCIKRKINRNKYYENLARVQFLPLTSGYNDQKKKADKDEFVTKMKALITDVYSNC